MGLNLTLVQRFILFLSLGLATFMMVLDYSIANVAIPYIAGDLAVSNDEGTYVITSFAVGNAIGLAMTGWLTRRVGEVKLIVIAILLFTLFSWACGLSVNLNMLVINRFIQGLVAGPIIPLSQSLLISRGKPENRALDLSIWATIVITAPVLGPVLGGYISEWYHWPWIFYINIPVGIFCAVVIWTLLSTTESQKEKTPIDIPGIILLVIGVSCLQVFLDKGQQWDWLNSIRIRSLIIGAIIAFTFLIIREFKAPYPFLNLRLFKNPSFSLSIVCLVISYAIYFGTVVLVPLWLQEYMGYTAEWAGFAVCTLGIAPVFLSGFTPKIIGKIGNEWTLLIAFIIFAGASFYQSFFTTDIDIFHIALARFFFGIGFAFYITPLTGMSVAGFANNLLPAATGIFHFVRAMVGGIGTSVFTTLWVRRTIFHHFRVGESLTLGNFSTPESNTQVSLAQLNNSLDVQAAMLALNDALYFMTWLYLGLIAVLISWNLYTRFSARRRLSAASSPPITVD